MRTRHLLAASLTMILFACSSGGTKPTASPRPSPSPSPKPVFCPLTGVETTRSKKLDRPPLAVKIENSTPARPQAGLDAADIVYEELAEGGITRFMAIFHCADSSDLGPVRSARLVDPDILQAYAPVLFGYSGANPIVDSKVRSTRGITDLEDDGVHGKAYHRQKGRPAPHNLFTTIDALRAFFTGSVTVPKTGFIFNKDAVTSSSCAVSHSPSPSASAHKSPTGARSKASPSPSPGCSSPGGRNATPSAASPVTSTVTTPTGKAVSFQYSGSDNLVRYVFDAAASVYKRFHGAKPHLLVGGSQVSVTNVVILKVKVVPGTIKDAAGNTSPDITVIGTGGATVLRGGVAVEGRWTKSSATQQMTLADLSGRPIELLPGNTWVHLIPNDQQVNVT
ncbi:MAG: DUF3048 domain-containing protein [Actinomycetota bacterium]|nr:DUF3048 domain-containing protein [Actinomycetota bacterium]